MIRGAAEFRCSGHADHELATADFANRIRARAWFAENVDDQRRAFPQEETIISIQIRTA